MKSWSQLILQKVPDKISASQFLLVLLTLDSNLYHIFYTISFYTIIVQKNRTLFHKLFPPLSRSNVALSFCTDYETLRKVPCTFVKVHGIFVCPAWAFSNG